MKEAEARGKNLTSLQSKFVKGVGEALKNEGKEASEAVSEGFGEVIKGFSNGMDKSLDQTIIKANADFFKTFEIGRTDKEYSTLDSNNNETKKLMVYLIANQYYDGKIKLKAFDIHKKELGRSVIDVKMQADDAAYVDFEFDKRTPMMQAAYFVIEKKESEVKTPSSTKKK